MKNKINESTPLFTEKEYEELRKLGLTDEEYESLQDAEAVVATVDMLPEGKELDKFFVRYKNLFAGKNPAKEIEEFYKLAETDQEFFLQICAFFNVWDMKTIVPENRSTVQKVSLDEIKQENHNQETAAMKEAFLEFAKIYEALTPEEKEEFRRVTRPNN